MANPTSTTDYPAFSGATGKRDMLQELWESKDCPGVMIDIIFRISNTDLNALTDKSTIYDPADTFTSAVV